MNFDCIWLIEPPGADTISLNFPTFDPEAGYDSVMVYDGATTSDTLSGKLISENSSINISGLSNGLYFFKAGKESKQAFKIIKN